MAVILTKVAAGHHHAITFHSEALTEILSDFPAELHPHCHAMILYQIGILRVDLITDLTEVLLALFSLGPMQLHIFS